MPQCRHCGTENDIFLSLGSLPPANTFLKEGETARTLPLNVFFCAKCTLMQLEDVEKPENIFNDDFKYFSSYSSSLIGHSREYCNMVIQRLSLKKSDAIVEIASNDGYLLDIFRKIGYNNLLGVEPSGSVAKEAISKGIPTEIRFFNDETAKELSARGKADLIIANNVMAHVPDINSFASGIATLLKKDGTATVEFQYVADLLAKNAFDMIYHEHFSYLSLHAMDSIMKSNGLFIYDVERLKTQGGSLRVYAAKIGSKRQKTGNIERMLDREKAIGIDKQSTYSKFARHANDKKQQGLDYLRGIKEAGKTIACYGAAAKGSTFLNYLGIDDGTVDYVVDRNTEKQGLYMAGCGLKVYPTGHLSVTRPDYVWILPWNIRDEIISEHGTVRGWGGKFLVMVPEIDVI
ncbi:MAG: class I SAM-dependent methyltransferase [Eubacteriales bacterium]|nr:class I SAM-dependent methyltransferase [Eubacteriales bacterium]